MNQERRQKIVASFMTIEEKALTTAFLEKGYLTIKAEDGDALDKIQQLVARLCSEFLGIAQPSDTLIFWKVCTQKSTVAKLMTFGFTSSAE